MRYLAPAPRPRVEATTALLARLSVLAADLLSLGYGTPWPTHVSPLSSLLVPSGHVVFP